jgi:hypothetical protein
MRSAFRVCLARREETEERREGTRYTVRVHCSAAEPRAWNRNVDIQQTGKS